jgi:hypothetical protein
LIIAGVEACDRRTLDEDRDLTRGKKGFRRLIREDVAPVEGGGGGGGGGGMSTLR